MINLYKSEVFVTPQIRSRKTFSKSHVILVVLAFIVVAQMQKWQDYCDPLKVPIIWNSSVNDCLRIYYYSPFGIGDGRRVNKYLDINVFHIKGCCYDHNGALHFFFSKLSRFLYYMKEHNFRINILTFWHLIWRI